MKFFIKTSQAEKFSRVSWISTHTIGRFEDFTIDYFIRIYKILKNI